MAHSQSSVVINNYSQISVAKFEIGKIFSSPIFTNLLLSLPVKKTLKSVNIWQNYRQ